MLNNLISFLNSIPTEIMIVIEFIILVSMLLCFLRFFGLIGLIIFQIISLFTANIQAVKMVEYNFYPDPVGLGKVMIGLSFFTIDVVAEFYGKKIAKKSIWLGLFASVCFSILMLLTIGYKPLSSNDPNYMQFVINDESIKNIFMPLPSILIASVISYLLCQHFDVLLFSKIKEKFKGKYLWIRSFIAPALTAFFDSCIFYTLAFHFLSNKPIKFEIILHSYILGTYLFRIVIIFIASYVMYIAKYIVETNKNKLKSMSLAYDF